MRAKILTMLVVALGLMVWAVQVSQAVPMGTAFTYQGRLIDANNTADGLYDFQFRLFDANTTGNQAGSDVNLPDVDVIDGYFTVELDFGSSVFGGNAVWLQIAVRPGDMNDPNVYTTLSPRQEITPTPYALYTLNGGGMWSIDGNDIYYTGGNVGIGTTTPSSRLHTVDTTPNSDAPAIYGEHAVTDYYGIGIKGVGLYKGVEGSVNATGVGLTGYYGVFGSANTSNSRGTVYGVYGHAGGSAAGYGVFGYNSNSGNYGYLGGGSYGAYGENNASGNYGYLGDPNYGVYGENNASGNYGYLGGNIYGVYGRGGDYGVYGQSSNFGVYGENDNGNSGYLGSSSAGVYGNSYSDSTGVGGSSDSGFGVSGSSVSSYGVSGYSSSSYGVYGENYGSYNYGYLGGSSYGVYGENNNGNRGYLGVAGGGVEGRSDSGFGVYGWSNSNYGVYGYGNSNNGGFAGYFAGNVYVTGTMSAETVTDRTPYPKDLATAYKAVMSMERLPDGQYEENNKEKQLDHSRLSAFIKSKDGNRDLSATVSCLNEVVKDLIKKVEAQRQQIEIQNTQIRQMIKTSQTNKQQPQIGITKGAVQ